MSRPPSAESLLRNSRQAAKINSISSKGGAFVLPNTSGDHVRGLKRDAPVEGVDLVNKDYVDDEIDNKIEDGTAAGQMAFWNGTKWVKTETSELVWDDTNKRLGIGTNNPVQTLGIKGNLNLYADTLNYLSFSAYNSTGSAYDSRMSFRRARGSAASKEPVLINDRIGTLSYAGYYTATAPYNGIEIFSKTTENWSATNRGAYLLISGVVTGSSTRTDWLMLKDGNVGIGTTSPSEKLDINSDAIRLRTAQTPASASAAGKAGMICWDASYIYVCVATNTWKRTALSSW